MHGRKDCFRRLFNTREGASHQGTPDDPVVAPELLALFALYYLGAPTVTPFYADFSGLPPTLVHVGTRERLHDDSVTVVERLKAAGVAADLKIFDGMCHNWQLYAPMLDEGMASIEQCAAFIKAHQAQ
jgi:monoterpene epsilon-lactone hydrolase